jgi:serine/threonine-protein kinase
VGPSSRLPPFTSEQSELQFLRAVHRVTRLADDVMEDSLARGLGLAAGLDIFLSYSARMLRALSGAVVLEGAGGPLLRRTHGALGFDPDAHLGADGAVPLPGGRVLLVCPLDVGGVRLGALALELKDPGQDVVPLQLALLSAMADQLDGAVLAFAAVEGGQSPRERLEAVVRGGEARGLGRLGPYALLSPLGSGGMAQVLAARGPDGRVVALKRMLPHLLGEPELVEAFLTEARLGQRMEHPNVVRVLDMGQDGDTPWFAMELLRGVDFAELLRAHRGGLPLPVLSAVVAQGLRGLHAAHVLEDGSGRSLELVHRDLSPHNLMVGFDGNVKVLDFGVARSRMHRGVTAVGLVKGKPLYMSPEQAAGERLDARSDLFSMGLVLYEGATGVLPFDRGDDMRSMEAIVHEPLAPHPRLAGELWDVVQRALHKSVHERYRDARAMAEALEEAETPSTRLELAAFTRGAFPEKATAADRFDARG